MALFRKKRKDGSFIHTNFNKLDIHSLQAYHRAGWEMVSAFTLDSTEKVKKEIENLKQNKKTQHLPSQKKKVKVFTAEKKEVEQEKTLKTTDVHRMKRAELIKWLKSNDVQYSEKMKVKELKAIIKKNL